MLDFLSRLHPVATSNKFYAALDQLKIAETKCVVGQTTLEATYAGGAKQIKRGA